MFKKINSLFLRLRNNRIRKNENKRKEILQSLPENSFARKLYSHENLNIEIGLLKMGSEIINISKKRKKTSVVLDKTILDRLSLTEDLSKATFIHTHILKDINNSQQANISPADFVCFVDYCRRYGMSKFAVSIFNKELIEIGRIQLKFSKKFITEILKKSEKDLRKWTHATIMSYEMAGIKKKSIIS
jgi:hypothetical protein